MDTHPNIYFISFEDRGDGPDTVTVNGITYGPGIYPNTHPVWDALNPHNDGYMRLVGIPGVI